jgi:aspartate aminotransferase-like enzyme
VRALGFSTWVEDEFSSDLVTALTLSGDIEAENIVLQIVATDADLSVGIGPGAERLLRLNHTGQRARREPVLANVAALAEALGKCRFRADFDAAKAAIDAVYVGS